MRAGKEEHSAQESVCFLLRVNSMPVQWTSRPCDHMLPQTLQRLIAKPKQTKTRLPTLPSKNSESIQKHFQKFVSKVGLQQQTSARTLCYLRLRWTIFHIDVLQIASWSLSESPFYISEVSADRWVPSGLISPRFAGTIVMVTRRKTFGKVEPILFSIKV